MGITQRIPLHAGFREGGSQVKFMGIIFPKSLGTGGAYTCSWGPPHPVPHLRGTQGIYTPYLMESLQGHSWTSSHGG